MKTTACAIGIALIAFTLSGARPGAQELKEKLMAAKAAAAKDAQAMRSYTWLEKTELSVKGEVKNTKVDSCRYGPDGKVQKTPVVTPPPPEKKRGLKGKAIAKKTGEMKAELESASRSYSAIARRPMMQAVMTRTASSAGGSRCPRWFPATTAGDSLIYVRRGVTATSCRDDMVDKPDEPACR
jgi:hypothetical protein